MTAEESTRAPAPRGKPTRWKFWTVLPVILALVLVGQAVGQMMAEYPPHLVLKDLVRSDTAGALERLGGLFGAMEMRDWLFTAFLLATAGYIWMERQAVKRFFRSMVTGVTLVVLSTLAITVGVLVPQIEGFEDPDMRVDLAREQAKYELYKEQGYVSEQQKADGHNQYGAFRWAEGYFIYHLLHLYGIGMPEAELPDGISQQLDRFGRRYGEEEQSNRRKQMSAAFSGQATTRAISEWIHDHEDFLWGFFKVATWLDLNRVYKSNWFAALLCMLFAAVALNTFRGPPRVWLSMQKIGSTVTHVGMLVLLTGGLISNLGTDRGLMPLDLSQPEPVDTYNRHYDPAKKARMPFALSLERFARMDWKALEVYFTEEDFTSRPPSYTLWEGREIDLDFVPKEGDSEDGELRPRVRLIVEELHDRARVGLPKVYEAKSDEDGLGPVAVVSVGAEHGPEGEPGRMERRILAPGLLDPTIRDPLEQWRLRPVYDHEGDGIDVADHFPPEELFGRLDVSIRGRDVRSRPYELRFDTPIRVPSGYTIEMTEATTNFQLERGDGADPREIRDPRPLAQQPLGLPAVHLRITGPDGAVERDRVVIAGINPVEHGFQDAWLHSDLVCELRWDPWRSPGPPRYLLEWGPDGEVELVDEAGTSRPVALSDLVPVPGPTRMVLDKVVHDAALEQNIDFLASNETDGGWDPDFYAREPRGLELEVVHDPGTPDEVRETIKMATTEQGQSHLWQSGDGRFILRFFENSEMLPYEWRSVLRIWDRDENGELQENDLGGIANREIRVNDYLYYKGYRMFQTDANAKFPTYSGIGIVYDPGIPVVLFGMYTIIAGATLAFLVRPIVKRKRA